MTPLKPLLPFLWANVTCLFFRPLGPLQLDFHLCIYEDILKWENFSE